VALKSFCSFCCAVVHAGAAFCALCSLYFFLFAAIDYVLIAIILFGLATGLEVVAAVIGEDKSVPG
jgi:hypothetical protein